MMRRMHPVLCFGEALIDFVPLQKGQRLAEVDTFARVPGGAPANVAAAVARLGGKALFAGQVGRDGFGDCLRATLDAIGVDTRWLQQTSAAKTALAFVSLSASGERDFAFYRDPSADMLFPAAAVRPAWFEGHGIFHFGTLSLTHPESRAATGRAVALARDAGWLVSFDPNARLDLWPSPDAFIEAALALLPSCDIVKLAEDELALLGVSPATLFARGPRALLLTYGQAGARIVTAAGLDRHVPGMSGTGDRHDRCGGRLRRRDPVRAGPTGDHPRDARRGPRGRGSGPRLAGLRQRLRGLVGDAPRRHPVDADPRGGRSGGGAAGPASLNPPSGCSAASAKPRGS